MLFDSSDIDLLRLTGFLKNLPIGQEEKYSLRLLTLAVLGPLQEYGYLGLTRNGLSYSLKPAGYDLLCSLGFDYPQDKRQPSHRPELHRRFDGAAVFLTFYRAGMEVFSSQLSGLREPLSYVHGSVIRRDPCMANTRLFGGCRFSGIGRVGNTAYAVHPYGCHAGLIFARHSYLAAARLLAAEPPEEKARNDSVTYREAYEKTSLPVHLLECSDAGAFQLRIMALDEYRPKMAGLLLGKGYQPPDPRIPDSDSLLSDGKTRLPFVAAVDMDLKRIDRAYIAAREAGCPKLAMGALEPQAKALQLLYQVTGKAVVYSVAIPDLLKSLRDSGQQGLVAALRLYEPQSAAYITQEGGVLHASAVPSHRKAGEPDRPEIWPLDGQRVKAYIPFFFVGWYFYGMFINSIQLGIASTFHPPDATHGTSGWMDRKEMEQVVDLGSTSEMQGILLGKLKDDPDDDDKYSEYVAPSPKNHLNSHIIIYGASGSGKTRGIIKPFIMQAIKRGESLVCVDPKGELFESTSQYARDNGAVVKAFNLLDKENSDGINFLAGIEEDNTLIQTIAETIIKNTSNANERQDFWEKAELNLLCALLHYVQRQEDPRTHQALPIEQRAIGDIYKILSTESITDLETRFADLPKGHPALAPYGLFKQANRQIWGNIAIGLGNRLSVFQDELVDKITRYNDIDLLLPGQRPCVYYCIISAQDSSLEFLSFLLFSLMFTRLPNYARKNCQGGRLPIPVNFVLDEFCNVGYLGDFKKTISVCRSFNLNCQLATQGIAQLSDRYPNKEWEEIIGNCDTQLFLGCNDQMTAEYISDKCGQMTIRTTNSTMPLQPLFSPIFNSTRPYSQSRSNTQRPLMLPDELLRLDNSQEIVLFRGHKPLQLYKITPEELPDFEKLQPVRITDYIPEWRKLEEEKAREMRERRTTQRESPPPPAPPRQEYRQPPKKEENPYPVREPMRDRPLHPQREEIPAYTPMRLVRENSRPPLTHPARPFRRAAHQKDRRRNFGGGAAGQSMKQTIESSLETGCFFLSQNRKDGRFP